MPDSNAVALSWRKSSASASGDCVEVAALNDYVLLRDSKRKRPHHLTFTYSEWKIFLSAARTGKFDVNILKKTVRTNSADH